MYQSWNQGGWPFSYIDLLVDCGSKIFKLSDDVEIKTGVLFLITDLALQTSLAMKHSAKKLQLGVIFVDEEALPLLIADIYKV